MAGYQVFTAGQEALASDVNSLLMSQTVARFTNVTSRTAALVAPVLNQLSMRDDRPGVIERWNGSSWVTLSTAVDGLFNNNVAITATTAATSQDVANLGAVAFDGTAYRFDFFCGSVAPAPGTQVIVNFFDGATDLGWWGALNNPSAGTFFSSMSLRRVLTPSAGAHTYHATAWVSSGSTTFFAGAGTGAGVYGPILLSAVKIV